MKYLLYLLLVIVVASCTTPPSSSEKGSPIEIDDDEITIINCDPLIGHWVRTDGKEGVTTHEHWKKTESGTYVGMGCTLQGADTVWKEELLIKTRHGQPELIVSSSSNETVHFPFELLDEHGFVCSNETNEFPKRIAYEFLGDELKATISGGGPEIDFSFVRISP